MRLTAYSGTNIPVKGSRKFWKPVAHLPLLVVEGEGPSLFGRYWLKEIRPDWHSVHGGWGVT